MGWETLIREDLEGLVPYAPGLRASQVRERSGVEHILKLSSNEHPRGPFPRARAAIDAVAPHLNIYPDGSSRALRRALSAHLGVPEENIAVGNGSNELLDIVTQAVVRPGDEVVFAWPSFIVYPLACTKFGATAVRVPLADDVHDLEAILAAITDKTRLVFLCNPNNPTGTIYSREEFASFMKSVPDHVLVALDEAYFEFVTAEDHANGLDWFDGERPVVVLRTFSKIYSLAGLRIGYAVAPEPLVRAIDKLRAPFNANSVAQAAAYYSLTDQEEVALRRQENSEMRVRLADVLTSLRATHAPSQANFVWMHTSRGDEVFDALLGQGVIVRNFGGSALRVGVPAAEDMDMLANALTKVRDDLGGL